MRLIPKWAVAVLLVTGLTALCGCGSDDDEGSSGNDYNGSGDPNVVVCCGDSITASYGYPEILAGMIGKTTVNLAAGGARSASGLGQVNSGLATYNPAYLLLLFGANDVTGNVDPNATVENLRAMVNQAKASGAVPVVGTLTPMYGGYADWQPAVETLNGLIRRMASDEGVAVAALDSAFGNNASLIGPDGLHPTEAGSVVIADTFGGRL